MGSRHFLALLCLALARPIQASCPGRAGDDCAAEPRHLSGGSGGTAIRVKSAGWSDGNVAEFYINGTRLSVPVARGLNVVVLRPDGTMASSATFDTFAAGSDALAALLNGLAQGTPVLIAAQDEPATNLTAAARSAIRGLGAAQIDAVRFRSAYALVGLKGGPALAEQQLATGAGVANITAVYTPGQAATPSAPSVTGATNITVQSAGWSDGNLAQFYINGSRLSVSPARGLNVVVLRPDGTMLASYVFDTFAAGSDALISMLNGLPAGTPVLIAAMDEAATNLTVAARTAIKLLGATSVDNLAFRSSYAFIGIKGGVALAEKVLPELAGVSIVSATYPPIAVPIANFTSNITVRSACWSDGNFAQFYVNSSLLAVPTARGLNVVVLRPTGAMLAAYTFDTFAAGSDGLVNLLNGLATGTPVLIAAMDEAATNLTAAARTAIKGLGSLSIDALQFRSSYALIGIKGGTALGESLLPERGGVAGVSAAFRPGAPVVPPVAGAALRVRSAGFSDGNLAEFYVRGSRLAVATGRGLNVVQLTLDGSFQSASVFDTHAGGSEPLVAFVAGLALGTPVLVAAMDEAMGNISDAGKRALVSLGATQTGSLTYRGSYALIGIYGGAALAERAAAERAGPVDVSAQYIRQTITRATTTTTTTTTTSTKPPGCPVFTCPAGLMLKADLSGLNGFNASLCCEPAVANMVSAAVRSAGFSDGNTAEFFVDGSQLNPAVGRGMNVVVLRADGSFNTSRVFDTMLSGSDALVAFVSSIPPGTVVLVAAVDEAATNLTRTAKDAIKTLGARSIDSISWRGSYALIGVKNGTAIAERVLVTNAGPAFVSGRLQVVKPDLSVLKPVCPARSANPPVAGYLSQGQLNLEAGCRYQLWESKNAGDCLQGGWVVIIGGSNTILMSIQLSNLLATDAMLPIRDGASMGSATIIDVIIDQSQGAPGVVLYRNSRLITACNQPSLPISTACRTALQTNLAAAPAYTGRGTRVTLFQAQYWDQAETGLDMAMGDVGWATAKVAVLVQVGTWYVYCSVKQVDWCTRPTLLQKAKNEGIQAALEVYKTDMTGTLSKLQTICRPGGRASVYGCMVGLNSWQNPSPGAETLWYTQYNNAMAAAVAPIGSELLRSLDFWTLGSAMASEEYGGHSSPVMMIWNWQVMLGGMCPASQAAKGTYAEFQGPLCFVKGSSTDQCPNYRDNCKNTFRCELWECMNSVPCAFRATSKTAGPEADAAGLCEQPLSASFPALEQAAGKLCRRIWCADDLEWLLPVAGWLLLGALWLATRYGERLLPERLRAKFASPPPKKGQKPAAAEAAQKDGKALPAKAPDSTKADTKVVPETKPSEAEKASPALTIPGISTVVAVQDDAPAPSAGDAMEEACDGWKCHGCGSSNPATRTECLMCDLHHWVDPEQSDDDDDEGEADSDGGSSEPVSPRTPLRDADGPVSIDFGDLPPVSQQAEAAPPALPVQPSVRTIKTKASKGSKKKAAPPFANAAGDRFPLGLARFSGSTHVVVGHLYALGATPNQYFYGWGFTWVPWFFMMSGFVLMTAHLRRPKDESVLDYVMRRSVGIYPLYAVSLIPAFAIAKAAQNSPDAVVLASQSFLTQAWVPIWTEQALQSHCWFLSAMVVYWACFKPVARLMRALGLYTASALMAVTFLLPWLIVWIPASTSGGVYWYEEHDWGATKTRTDIAVVMFKFHPLCYFHVFLVGALLARIRLLLDAKAAAEGFPKYYSRILEFVAPLGYLGLALVFSVRSLQPAGFKLSARLSVLLPFQAMILFGLAGLPSLPLARVAWLAQKLDWLENYSFAVYVFQFICYDFWPKSGVITVWAFFLWLWAFVGIIVPTVQRPVQKWWGAHARGRLAVPFVLGGLLVGLSFIPETSSSRHVADLPAVVQLEPGMVDMRLPLVDPEGSGSAIINPSLAVVNGKLVIVARRHRQDFYRSLGDYVAPDGQRIGATIIDQTWTSQILMGSVELTPEAWTRWPTTGVAPFNAVTLSAWSGLTSPSGNSWSDLCVEEQWIASNNTLIRQIVTGPEDPKVIPVNGSIALVFDSMPPQGHYGCANNTAHTQMYLSSDIDVDFPSTPVLGNRMSCGTATVDEKNWIPFTYQGQLKFVYSPLPHAIVASDSTGGCLQQYETSYKPLLQLKRDNRFLDIRGSAQAVFINDTLATPSLPHPHYLGLLHIFDRKTSGYAHFAYRFSASPPFNILQVSTQLPLMAAQADPFKTPFAFANGLVVQNRTVVVSYGAGDRDARALVLTLQRLDAMFACSAKDTSINVTMANASTTSGPSR